MYFFSSFALIYFDQDSEICSPALLTACSVTKMCRVIAPVEDPLPSWGGI